MKRVTIEYIPGLGDFLDENKIEWHDNGNGTITMIFKNDAQIFVSGWLFGQFYSKQKAA